MNSSYPDTIKRIIEQGGRIADAINSGNYAEAVRLCHGYAMNGLPLRACRELAGLPHDAESTAQAVAEYAAECKARSAAKYARK